MPCHVCGRAPIKTRDVHGRWVCGKRSHQLRAGKARRDLRDIQHSARNRLVDADDAEEQGLIRRAFAVGMRVKKETR